MSLWREIASAWRTQMTAADKARVLVAAGFPFGAIGHFAWLIRHGDPFYHGPAPEWAVWFWYALCFWDFVMPFILLALPRIGVALAALTMMIVIWVNWTQFPTFEFQFNWVLLGLTTFGVITIALSPWLWAGARWRLSSGSSERSAG